MSINWYVLSAIILLSLCSLLTRCTYMLFGDRIPLPDNVRSALRYAPVAALIAIIIPELLPLSYSPSDLLNPRALAAVSAIALFIITRNSLAVILGGMVSLWLIEFIFSVVF